MLQVVSEEQGTSAAEAALTAHRPPEQPKGPGGWRQVEALPIGLFAAVMGLTGLSIAWTLAHTGTASPLARPGHRVGGLRRLRCPRGGLRRQGRHRRPGGESRVPPSHRGQPVRHAADQPASPADPLAPLSLHLARLLWIVGALGMTLFAWWIVTRWLSDRQQAAHATPAWIVPVVGLLDVPLALPVLGLPPMPAVMVFALAVGLFFALPLFTLILSRLLFEAPLPAALQPSLLILFAPFAVGFSAYVATTGTVDLFAEALFAVALFLLAVLLPKLARFGRSCPFRVSWWGVSFPLAAASVAALRIATAQPGPAIDILALGLLTLATAVIGWLLARTLVGLARGELRTLAQ